MLHLATQTTYLPTDLTDAPRWLFPALFCALVVLAGAWLAYGKYKRDQASEEGREADPLSRFKHIALPVILAGVAGLSLLGAGSVMEEKSNREQAENLAHNVLEAYEIDAIEEVGFFPQRYGKGPWFATIHKDEKAYQVEVAENPQTYEPTLLPKKGTSPIDLDSLKKDNNEN